MHLERNVREVDHGVFGRRLRNLKNVSIRLQEVASPTFVAVLVNQVQNHRPAFKYPRCFVLLPERPEIRGASGDVGLNDGDDDDDDDDDDDETVMMMV